MDIPVWVQKLIQDIVPDISVGGDVIVPEQWVFVGILFLIVLSIEEPVRRRETEKDPPPKGRDG